MDHRNLTLPQSHSPQEMAGPNRALFLGGVALVGETPEIPINTVVHMLHAAHYRGLTSGPVSNYIKGLPN